MPVILTLGVVYTTAKGSWLVPSVHALFSQDVPVILAEMLGTLAALSPRSILRCLSKTSTQSRDQVVVNCCSHSGTVSACGLPPPGNKYISSQGNSSHPLGRGQEFPPPFISLCPQPSCLGHHSVHLRWAEQRSFWGLLSKE